MPSRAANPGRKECDMKERIIIDTVRDGYAVDQIRSTMTVEELIDFLQDLEGDTPIYLAFDNRYTYGGLNIRRIEVEYDEEDENE